MRFRKMNQALLLIGGVAVGLVAQQVHRDGYKDTPVLPNQKWHVHDPDRPYPPEITPGATAGAAPSDAVVLFDGKDLSKWQQRGRGADRGKMIDAKWKVQDGYMEIVHGTGDLVSRDKFGDCQLHVEWQEPAGIEGESQERGNSGVYLMSRYEIQVLDNYHAATYADGMAGAIYGQWPPLVNPSRKPGEWQDYDIIWTAPRFNGEQLATPPYLTMLFNGVLVHNHRALIGPTSHRKVVPWEAHPLVGPLRLQDHGNPMRFRNIWYRPLEAE
jgi:hypothetical protein